LFLSDLPKLLLLLNQPAEAVEGVALRGKCKTVPFDPAANVFGGLARNRGARARGVAGEIGGLCRKRGRAVRPETRWLEHLRRRLCRFRANVAAAGGYAWGEETD